MRGLFIEAGRVRYRTDLPEPASAAGETLVQVLKAGVCATDLALVDGYMSFCGVPGHEFVGVALDGPLEGQRVVGEINAACGRCARCAAGLGRHCAERTVLGIAGRPGAFAERLSLPLGNLLPVPGQVTSDAATFTEPLAAAHEILLQVGPVDGLAALVIGDGRLGLLCARTLELAGARTTLAGRHPERASFLGPAAEFVAGLPDAGDAPSFDLVVEASGRPELVGPALARVRPRGTLVLKTTSADPATLDLAPLVVNEITLVGSRCGPFAPALARLAAGELAVESLIHARYGLEDGPEALRRAGGPGVLKVLFEVSES